MNDGVTLVGDGIENPANALVMAHAAQMFGAACRFRDTKGLAQSVEGAALSAGTFPAIEPSAISGLHSRIVAFDNLPGAAEVYGYEAGRDFAVMVGNERRGLSYECARLATDKVQVPMLSRRINCLNEYHYRLMATIALAEISRQVGRRPAAKVRPAARPPIYDHQLGRLAEAAGEIVRLDELADY
jgi:hypothetical protein